MIQSVLILVFALLAPIGLWASEEQPDPGKVYMLESKRLPVQDRINRALETMESSEEESVLAEAVWDLARFCGTPERSKQALEAIDQLIEKSSGNSTVSKRATLSRARILAQIGQRDDAYEIFARAIMEQWDEKAYELYYESLKDNGEYAVMAIDRYQRVTSDQVSEAFRKFFKFDGDLVLMFRELQRMKQENNDTLAMEAVYPQLQECKGRPLAKSIAEALCLTSDKRYREALALINRLDDRMRNEKFPEARYDDSKDFPMYASIVLFYEAADFDAARACFREFMDLNQDNPERVLTKAVEITYGMAHSPETTKLIAELTGYLLQSELYMNEEIHSRLPEEKLASLMNMHHISLIWRGKPDEAARVSMQVMEKYYPQTLAGAVAARSFAQYLVQAHNDLDGAEKIYLDILDRAPFDGVLPATRIDLAGIAMMRQDYAKAVALLDEVIAHVGPSPREHLISWVQSAYEMREVALNKMLSASGPPRP